MRKLADIIAEKNRPDDRDLRSRTDTKKERQADEQRLADLAERLVGQADKRLVRLDMPESLLDAIHTAQRIRSATALNRQMRIVRRELRDSDASAIARQLDRLLNPRPNRPAPSQPADAWLERLLEGGDPALGELVTSHPGVDRQRLRQLVRNVSRAAPDRLDAARAALRDALREEVPRDE